jgi:hypothetical protein
MRTTPIWAALLGLGAAQAAHAGGSRSGAAALPTALTSACGGRLAGAKKAQPLGRHMQELVFEVWLARGPALVSVAAEANPCGDGGPGCAVVPIGKARGRLRGKLLDGGKPAAAFVASAGRCEEDACASILVLAAADASGDRILDAISVPGGCDATLAALPLVPGQDSLGLTCRSAAAGGELEQRMIFHVVAGKLTQQLSFDGGTTAFASPDERASGNCTIRSVGAVAVVKADGQPRLRVTRAPDDGQRSGDGAGPSCRHQAAIEQDYRWDAAQRQLIADGASRSVTRDVCDCAK